MILDLYGSQYLATQYSIFVWIPQLKKLALKLSKFIIILIIINFFYALNLTLIGLIVNYLL